MTQTISSLKFTIQVIRLIKIIFLSYCPTQPKNITLNRQEKVVLSNIINYQVNMSYVSLLFTFSAAEGRVQSLKVRSRVGLNTTKYILWHSKILFKKISPSGIVCHLLMFPFIYFIGNIKH